MIDISVIIPTHNPRQDTLARVVKALRKQSLSAHQWELVLIDNASSHAITRELIDWHPSARVVREAQLGLTHARLRGIAESQGSLIVWVDDDNILDPRFLAAAREAFSNNPRLGAAGGPSEPSYRTKPPPWFVEGLAPLGCRNHGDAPLLMNWDDKQNVYPEAAPIGAGLTIRREAINLWVDQLQHDLRRQAFGRIGNALSSGEDNDINLTLLSHGWELAYLPELRLIHEIPAERLTESYQQRLARASFRDFVQVLDRHGIRPWSPLPPWSIPFRSMKAWITCKAWSGAAGRIRWQGAVGQFEGRATLTRH